MNISGKIVEIFETQQISDTFKKREFVVEYSENPKFTEVIKFETVQDKCSLLDDYSVGNEVSIEFNLRGRKWTDPQGNDKYFNTLQAWKLSGNQQPQQEAPPVADSEPDWMTPDKESDDALPF